jgi:hypothetical protein
VRRVSAYSAFVGATLENERPHKRRCECGAADCTAVIEATWVEQDAVDHSGRDLWIVAPGHELRGARKAVVLSENERFSVVRAVEAHDPPRDLT